MDRKKHRLLLLIFACLTVALVFGSCNRKAVYSHYVHLPMDGWGWERTDTLFFDVSCIDSDGDYVLEIGLRCTIDYPFKELALVVTTELLHRNIWSRDTLNFQIADDGGNYLGDGVNLMQYVETLPQITLAKDDTLRVAIHHVMKRESLLGIAEVGLNLRPLQVASRIDTEGDE